MVTCSAPANAAIFGKRPYSPLSLMLRRAREGSGTQCCLAARPVCLISVQYREVYTCMVAAEDSQACMLLWLMWHTAVTHCHRQLAGWAIHSPLLVSQYAPGRPHSPSRFRQGVSGCLPSPRNPKLESRRPVIGSTWQRGLGSWFPPSKDQEEQRIQYAGQGRGS